MSSKGVPAAQDALLRRMDEIFSTDEREPFMERCLASEVNWPNVLDGVRLHGREAVRAYWARQFAAGHPLVRLEALRLDADGEAVVATVRPGGARRVGGRVGEETVEHVYRFDGDGLVTRMDVRTRSSGDPASG